MKRPDEAIERMRAWVNFCGPSDSQRADREAILAYLDSYKWPADLDRHIGKFKGKDLHRPPFRI